MGTWIYLALWLVAALVVIAFLSAGIAKHLRLRQLRREQALLLLDALERYGIWVAQQRHTPVFFGEGTEAAEALDEAGMIRMGWFPELAVDWAELLGVHNRLLHFLTYQHALRQRDAEGWLETDHDGRFLALWRHHNFVVLGIQSKLATLGTMSRVEEVITSPAPWEHVVRA